MARILVIDDEPRSRKTLVSALHTRQFDVLDTADGNTGLALAAQHAVDLILCDLEMPECDGLTVIEKLRRDPKLAALPLILVASTDDRRTFRKAMTLGADDYLVRPVTEEDLVQAINARLARVARLGPALRVAAVPTITSAGAPLPASEERATPPSPNTLSGETRVATVLFADIRNFDAFAERLSAEELSQLLQKFLMAACEPITLQGGRVVRFLGHGFMALFEAEAQRPSHARRALDAATAMQRAGETFQRWVEVRFGDRALPVFVVGTGVHTGEVATTTIGLGPHSEYTVFGEPVTIASQLDSATREIGCSVLASVATLEAAGSGVKSGAIHKVQVAGRLLPVDAAEVLSSDAATAASISGSIELSEALRFALEVNCEITSRAIKSAFITSRQAGDSRQGQATSAGAAPAGRAGKRPLPAEDLAKIRLPIKGYRVVSNLGRGGMSAVYLIEREADGLQLALKLLDTRGSEAAGLLERFIQEFQVISAICHPNVAAIYDEGVTDEGLFILMEYFERGDLKHRLRQGMTPPQALGAIMEVASGLREVHMRGVIHRDMKPENLLVRADGSLAVADFGIAKAGAKGLASTAIGALMGTPHYVSPEQVKGLPADARSDLYGLGVIFFEALAGRRPFQADQLDQLLWQHVNEKAPALPSNLSAYQPIVERLMAKNPADRYQSADELLAVLRALQASLKASESSRQATTQKSVL